MRQKLILALGVVALMILLGTVVYRQYLYEPKVEVPKSELIGT
jgi:hypothetical protein